MAVLYRIYPERGLLYARFWDFVTVRETLDAAQACALHPEFSPLFNQLIDFRGVDSFERDYARLIAMMAELPDHLLQPGTEPLLIFVAPSPVSQELANFGVKAMSGVHGPVLRVVKTLPEAIEVLGLPEHALGAG